VKRAFYPWLCEILISWLVFVGWIKEVFLFLPTAKNYLSEGLGLISRIVRAGRKEKLKFGRSHATPGLREVQFPQKNSPRETELRIFSELKLNLGVVRCNRTKPFKPC